MTAVFRALLVVGIAFFAVPPSAAQRDTITQLERHRQWLQLATEGIQDKSEAFECCGAKQRRIAGLAEHHERITTLATIFKQGCAHSSLNDFTIAKDELPD